MMKLIAAAMFTLTAGGALADPQQTMREDGSVIDWALDLSDGAPEGLIVLAQGSGCQPTAQSANLDAIRAAFPGFAALRVEKYGVAPDDNPTDDHSDCSPAYYEGFTSSGRLEDYLAALARLESADWWNGRLIVAGGSSGGEMVARIAARRKIDAGVMISSARGVSFGEMVRASIMAEMARHNVPPEEWPPVDEVFERARANPDSGEIWAGHGARFWADAIDYRAMDDLLASDAPLLLIQGGRDAGTPVAQARAVADGFAEAGRGNLTYWEYPALDHGLADPEGRSHLAEVLAMAAFWVAAQPAR
ncbi:MAG: hypothetical protein Q4G36_07825 [Paracoccus sp. (in: a-proteobacteria)]|nr:hypothetical protein [Paracoccus sp. (in: a-proteobacteria)]